MINITKSIITILFIFATFSTAVSADFNNYKSISTKNKTKSKVKKKSKKPSNKKQYKKINNNKYIDSKKNVPGIGDETFKKR